MAIVLVVFSFVAFPVCSFAEASGTAIDGSLTTPGFLEGWALEGKVETYSREDLYKHINGEAEMYLPYGFEVLTAAYFGMAPGTASEARTSMEIDIFKMRTLLDAFGIYSNYRDPDGEAVKAGADGVISQPKELELLKAPEISARSEKFVAECVLGYKFFPRGITAEAIFEGEPLKFFVVITESATTASTTLSLYFEYLKKEGSTTQIDETNEKTLITKDPLYKGVVLRQSGRYLLGICKLEDPSKGILLLDRWISRLKF